MKKANYYLIVDKEFQGHCEVYGGFRTKYGATHYFHSRFRASQAWVLPFDKTLEFIRQVRKQRAFYYIKR